MCGIETLLHNDFYRSLILLCLINSTQSKRTFLFFHVKALRYVGFSREDKSQGSVLVLYLA